MTKENRFSGLMGQVGRAKKSDQSQPKSTSTSSSPVKSKSADYTKLTVYITKALHKRLKVGAAEFEMELSDMAEAAFSDWLERMDSEKTS